MLEQHLVNLLLKLAVAASVASLLTRIPLFERLLMRNHRTLAERLLLAAGFGMVFGTGVAARVISHTYVAVDLGLEGSLLAGILGGYVAGLSAGVLIAVPAVWPGGELMSLPLFAGIGVLGGLLRDCAPDQEELWRFSPFFDLGLYRLLRRVRDIHRTLFHLSFAVTVILAESTRLLVWFLFGPHQTFSLLSQWPRPSTGAITAQFVTTLLAITLPLKIWNNTRNERKLEAQQRLLTEARLAALTSQINPHFLFNTLNSISTLVRIDPDQARKVIYKLSAILRRLMRQTENFVPLREELSFIEDYLGIELVRFGDKLGFVKDIAPDTLACPVPSMMLQPIVENCIKHGLSPKVEGGTIRLSTRLAGNRLHLTIEDDGMGIGPDRLAKLLESGIGISNVNERLRVLYGDNYRLGVDSQPHQGTRTEIDLPCLPESVTTPMAEATLAASRF